MVLVENDGASFNALAENAKRLGANQLQIVKDDAIEFLRIAKGRFDVVFLDPPFRRGVDGELLQLVEVFRAHVVDVTADTITIEATGAREKLSAFIDVLTPYGIKEIVQSGVVALARGNRGMSDRAPRGLDK